MAVALTLAGVLFAGCGSDNKKTNSSPTTAASTGGETTVNAAGTTVTIVAKDITFDQTALTAKAGAAVTFTLKNNDSIEHNLTIKDLKVSTDVKGGTSGSATVTPAAGTYEYHCEYHPAAMKGTLTVS